MRILLDTNVLLWSLNNSPRINSVRDLLLADTNTVFVSVVSWWEIAIKVRIGKLNASVSELRAVTHQSGFTELSLLGAHAEALQSLPRHHNDPFDHMLLAQAVSEPMHLLTGDSVLSVYSPLVMCI